MKLETHLSKVSTHSGSTSPSKMIQCLFSAMDIIYDLSQNVREKSIVPFARCLIERPVQGILMHDPGVNDICDSFNTVQTLQGSQEYLPHICLPTPR